MERLLKMDRDVITDIAFSLKQNYLIVALSERRRKINGECNDCMPFFVSVLKM